MEDHKFVHLHLHTEYSLLDGATRIKSLVKKCMDLGMTSVAMTDHGNMYAACTLFDECNNQYDDYLKSCKKKGIEPTKKKVKPIIGCEFYLCDNISHKEGNGKFAHLILLAKDEQGYKSLSKLNAIAYKDGFYYKPRIDYNVLAENSKGLICTSACVAGDIPQMLLNDNYEGAKELGLKLKNMFDDGDFYIEVQDHGLLEEKYVLPKLFELAKDIGVKTVATNDVHYLNKEDCESQDVLMCIQMRKTFDDPTRLKMNTDQLYLKTYDEMLELFPDHPESLSSTLEIADKCNFAFDYGHYKHPKYEPVTGEEPLVYLRKLIDEGVKKKYKERTKELDDRIEYELGIITKLGFVDYYLIVWDYINAARNMGISVGPGRGSGAGSVVAYLIGITNIDPLKYELYFERFLNPERVSAPDFDIDFEDSRREEVIDYVKAKYGEDRVVRIITFGTMAAKNAIKDVGRVLKIPFADMNNITKLIPNSVKRPYILEKCFGFYKPIEDGKEVDYSVPELVEMYNTNETLRKVVDIAIKLEDMPRQSSTHPCGVIIGKDSLEKFDPISKADSKKLGKTITTQYDGPQMEHLGHLKMDFLGLSNLTDIKLSIGYVKENYGVDIDFAELGYEDPEVFKLMASGNTKAIFQIESPGFQKFLKELKPTCIEDIVAGVSLYRPGPMDSIPMFVHNKHNPQDITYDAPCLEPILNYTYGCIVYQEQVMRIVQDMAGYSLGQADNVRRMMGKKQVDKMAKEEEVFLNGKPAENGKPAIDGAIKRGISEEVAKKVWANMANFAKYAFNKSHAAAYSLITYQTGFMKRYYEPEFLTAVLNNRLDKTDDLKNYMNHAKEENINILPPDVNKSDVYFTVKDKNIRFGLSALKHVGVGIVEKLVEDRKLNGDFIDINDFCKRMSNYAINKRMVESMIYSGAMDCFGKKRSQLIAVYENIMDRIASQKKKEASGQISMFDTVFKENALVDDIVYPNLPEFNDQEKLKHEKEIAGIYISGHPLDKYMEKFKNFTFNSTMIQQKEEPELEENDEDFQISDNEESFEDENTVKDGDKVEFGAIITDVKKILTKSNTEMCVLNVEDIYGSIEVVLFSKNYEKLKNIIEVDKICVIKGRVSVRDNGMMSILGEDIKILSEDKNVIEKVEFSKDTKLGLIYDTENKDLEKKIESILKFYPGNTEVYVRCLSTRKSFKQKINVNLCESLLAELYGYINKENVRLFK